MPPRFPIWRVQLGETMEGAEMRRFNHWFESLPRALTSGIFLAGMCLDARPDVV